MALFNAHSYKWVMPSASGLSLVQSASIDQLRFVVEPAQLLALKDVRTSTYLHCETDQYAATRGEEYREYFHMV